MIGAGPDLFRTESPFESSKSTWFSMCQIEGPQNYGFFPFSFSLTNLKRVPSKSTTRFALDTRKVVDADI